VASCGDRLRARLPSDAAHARSNGPLPRPADALSVRDEETRRLDLTVRRSADARIKSDRRRPAAAVRRGRTRSHATVRRRFSSRRSRSVAIRDGRDASGGSIVIGPSPSQPLTPRQRQGTNRRRTVPARPPRRQGDTDRTLTSASRRIRTRLWDVQRPIAAIHAWWPTGLPVQE
jgi:hypothetical protein